MANKISPKKLVPLYEVVSGPDAGLVVTEKEYVANCLDAKINTTNLMHHGPYIADAKTGEILLQTTGTLTLDEA
jgi:hypothetical protein